MDTVIWSIFNTGPPSSLRDLKVGEAKGRLARECGVSPPQCRPADHCSKLLGQVRLQRWDPHFLASTSRALMLLTRSQDYRWTHNNLVNALLELFNKETGELAQAKDSGEAESHRVILYWIIEVFGKVRCKGQDIDLKVAPYYTFRPRASYLLKLASKASLRFTSASRASWSGSLTRGWRTPV